MPRESNLLYVLIVACEVGFWVVLLAALAVRYLLRREALSRALLVSLPLLDLVLLAFTAADVRRGTVATFAHGLAAAYIGFTIAFGGLMVKWADAHFAHRFAAGPPPTAAPSRGWELVRYDGKLWGRCVVACLLTMALVEALVQFVGDRDATQELLTWHKHAFGCIVLWFVFGPVWSALRSAPVLLASRKGAPIPAQRARPWQWAAAVLLWVVATGIWMVAGPLTVRHGAYMSPQDAAWEGAWVLHARFWSTTGTVDYVKGLVVQCPSWLAVGLWALYAVLVAAARRLGVRHWVVCYVVTPMLLGQGIVGILYCSG